MGFGSYGTAWTWLHKIRKAMRRPERKPLAQQGSWSETPGTGGHRRLERSAG